MSYTELHYGKLKIEKEHLDFDTFKQFLTENPNLEVDQDDEDLLDDFSDGKMITFNDKDKKYKEAFYIPYICHKQKLYKMIEHSGEKESDGIDITTKNEDGTINFMYQFYNGGTWLGEMLEDGLNSLK